MKRLFILLSGILLLANSCIINDPPEAITKLIIAKDTNHLIQLSVFFNGQIVKEITLDANNTDTIFNNGGNGGSFSFFPFDTADSVKVTFDNQYSIIHFRDRAQNNTNRNIFDLSNWTKQKEYRYYFEYKYLFQDADYNEALNTN